MPSEVNYYFDEGSYLEFRKKLGETSSLQQKNEDILNHKFPCASYKATAFTNSGSLLLPSKFEFEAFSPEMPGPKPFLIYRYHGELTRIYDSVRSDAFVHGFGTKTYVEDGRFVTQSSPAAFVRYATTNAIIPNTNDPQMIAAAAHAKRTQVLGTLAPPSNKRMSTRSILILFGIGLTIFVLVILVLRQR